MLFSLLLYGLALILFIYIVFNIIRTQKFKTADAIAALGIVVSILLALRITPPIKIPSILSPSTTEATPTSSISESNNTNEQCPLPSSDQIQQIKNQPDVASAIQQAKMLAGNRQNDYKENEVIPANVVIATNLLSSPSGFRVTPIKNENGWGVFLTLEPFVAPNAGTYFCFQP